MIQIKAYADRFLPCQHDFLNCVSSFNSALFDSLCALTNGLGALLWLLADWVAQQCSACGRAALTLGQRLPYCGPTTFLPFRASSPSLPVPLTGAQRAVVSSTFLAHSSMTVINTSTDSVLCINNNIPVWLWDGVAGGGSAMTCFHCCQLLLLFGCQRHKSLKIEQWR